MEAVSQLTTHRAHAVEAGHEAAKEDQRVLLRHVAAIPSISINVVRREQAAVKGQLPLPPWPALHDLQHKVRPEPQHVGRLVLRGGAVAAHLRY